MKVFKFLAIFIAVMLFNCFLTGDAAAQNQQENKTPEKKTTVAQTVESTDVSQVFNSNQTNEKYRIGLQDTIEITVVGQPKYSLPPTGLNSDGTILMPRLANPIVAVCKTERELSQTIAALYRESILQNPFVSVRVVSQVSQPVAVIGAVNNPGTFNLNRPIQLLQLLALAGGPKIEKSGAKIQVARLGDVSGCSQNKIDDVQILSFTTKKVLAGDEKLVMQPFDVVSILEAEEAYVVGNVKKPTKVSLKEPVTLTQAIAAAEGLDDTAKLDKVTIQRQQENSPIKTELAFNLKDIRSKKIPDPILQANDIVEVSNDGSKSVKKKLIDVFSNGLPSLFYRVP